MLHFYRSSSLTKSSFLLRTRVSQQVVRDSIVKVKRSPIRFLDLYNSVQVESVWYGSGQCRDFHQTVIGSRDKKLDENESCQKALNKQPRGRPRKSTESTSNLDSIKQQQQPA